VQAHAHVQSHVHSRDVCSPASIEKVVSRPQKLKVQVQSHGALDASGCPPLAALVSLVDEPVGESTDATEAKPSSRASPLSSLAPSSPQVQSQIQIQAHSREFAFPISDEVDVTLPEQSRARYHSHTHASASGIASD
jgi:hypothetical protein